MEPFFQKPEILAPAGDEAAFFAAVAAGADAVYLGLKSFSARMEAQNFSLSQLARLVSFARDRGVGVFVAMNSLLKPNDLSSALGLVEKLSTLVKPKALIFADPGMALVARQAGFEGELHLSTLANVSHPVGLAFGQKFLGASRIILPRELSLDEIKLFAAACPPGLSLEVFVHGALCYAVSGRCYWSSLMGGKSGLRGRCVQPCRRLYAAGKISGRFFSCMDLGLDVLVKTLAAIPQVRAWKIEGRKKGPHFVYNTVAAYRMLRDFGSDPDARRQALELLANSLGRPTTHYGFLPQRAFVPLVPQSPMTSGLLCGTTVQKGPKGISIKNSVPLFSGDLLRIGSEDSKSHCIVKVRSKVPKAKGLALNLKTCGAVDKDSPVYLLDRRDPAIMAAIRELEAQAARISPAQVRPSKVELVLPKALNPKPVPRIMEVFREKGFQAARAQGIETAFWLSGPLLDALPQGLAAKSWWWTPPVIWPDEEADWHDLLKKAVRKGARAFVLNAPWHRALLPEQGPACWAGPFCNIANPLAIAALSEMGFAGAVISPELPGEDALSLPGLSCLPLGIVTKGPWPLCISRIKEPSLKTGIAFTSPKKENARIVQYGENYWIFSDQPLSIEKEIPLLKKAGYSLFVHLNEAWPEPLARTRTSRANWDIKLL
jgi:putative protease